MHRFFLEPEQCSGPLALTGREARHAVQVLRLRPGDSCVVLNGAGEEIHCEIEEAARHCVALRVLARERHEPSRYQVTLVQALPKGKLIETIIQKATELGAARIVPVITERVVPHLDREAVISKVERWKQTAVEAIKQCGTPWLPVVLAPLDFNSALAELSQQELVLVASLQTDHRHARDVVRDFFMQHGHQPSSICLWIGPEGDFSLEELAALRFAGAQAITLGQNVLRADTAAIAGLAIVMSALDALSSR